MASTFFATYRFGDGRVHILTSGNRDARGHPTLQEAVRANRTTSVDGTENRCPIIEVVTNDNGETVDVNYYPGTGNLA